MNGIEAYCYEDPHVKLSDSAGEGPRDEAPPF